MNQMPRATPEEPDETQEVGGTESKQNISKKKKKKKKKKEEEEGEFSVHLSIPLSNRIHQTNQSGVIGRLTGSMVF